MNMETGFTFAAHSPAKAGRMHSPDQGELIGAVWDKPSRIPRAPLDENDVFASTPKTQISKSKGIFGSSTPLASPKTCHREGTLKEMATQFEAKLANERALQAALLQKLPLASPGGKDHCALVAEANSHSDLIAELERKLNKAQHTLESLNMAQAEYHDSAKKVLDTEHQLHQQAAQKSKSNKTDVGAIRIELQQATAAMSLAAKRVEQMESITDLLIEQLSEKDAEIQELQQLLDTESAQHETQVAALSSERDALIDKMNRFKAQAADIERQDAEIKLQLNAVARRASDLEAVIEVTDKAHAETEARLVEEHSQLTAALEQVRQEQSDLQMQLAIKEQELADALQQAAKGTPKGNGAKIVLPMAFERIRETESRLKTEVEEAARLKAAMKSQNNEFATKLSNMEAERERAVAEKQASLEMMTRAAATATKEAAIKQETLNKLTAEIASMEAERDSMMNELEATTNRCLELEASVTKISHALVAVQENKAAAEEQVASLNASLDALKSEKNTLQNVIKEKSDGLSALESVIDGLNQEMSNAAAVHKVAIAELKQALSASEKKVEELEASLAETKAERDAAYAEHDVLQSRIAELQSQFTKTEIDVETNSQKMETAVQDLQRELTAAFEAKLAVEALLGQAEERVVELQQQLKSARATNVEQASEYESLKNTLEGTISDLGIKLSTACEAQSALNTELVAAQQALAAKDTVIANLQSEVSAKQEAVFNLNQQIKTLEKESKRQVVALQAQITNLVSERDGIEQERDRIHSSLISVAEELKVKEAELMRAQAQGTPKGEGAKSVVRLAFEKIRGLQQAAQQAETTIANQEAAIAKLQAADAEKDADIEDTTSKLEDALEIVGALQTELQAAQTMCEQLMENNGDLAKKAAALTGQMNKVQELESALNQATATLDATTRELEVVRSKAGADAESRIQEVQELLAASHSEKLALTEQLKASKVRGEQLEKELADAKIQGTPKGEGAKKLVGLSFDKIRGLQLTLEEQHTTIKDLEAKLECVEDNAVQLAAELNTKSKALSELYASHAAIEAERDSIATELIIAKDAAEAATAAQDALESEVDQLMQALHAADQLATKAVSLEKDNAALERAMSRLRVDVQEQLEAKQSAQAEIISAQAEIIKLTEEVASLKESLDHLGEVVNTADDCIKDATETAEMTELEWREQVKIARRGKHEADIKAKAALKRAKEVEADSKTKIAASQKAAEDAVKKAKKLEQELKDRKNDVKEADVKAKKLVFELQAAQAQVEKLTSETQKRGAAEMQAQHKLKAAQVSLDELREQCDSHQAAEKKAKKKLQKVETALKAAKMQIAELTEAKDAETPITTLQADDKENQDQKISDYQNKLSEMEFKLEEALNKASFNLQERTEFAKKASNLAGELFSKEQELEEMAGMLQEVSEALAIQKDLSSTSQELSAAREREYLEKLEAAQAQVAVLETKLASLQAQASKVDVLERTQAELCAQLYEATSERRASSATSENNMSGNRKEKRRNNLKSDVVAFALGTAAAVLGLTVVNNNKAQ